MARVNAKARPRAVPKVLVRTALAGEKVANLGGSESEVRAVQEGVASGVMSKISVYGIDADGNAVIDGTLEFDGDSSGEVMISSDTGISMLEALDPSLGASVVYLANEMKASGLKPEFQFTLTDEVYADPERHRQVQERLGLRSAQPVSRADGAVGRTAIEIRPGQDKGTRLSIKQWRRG